MTGKGSKKTRRKYGDSFKEDVLKMVMSGRPVAEIATALGISENLVYNWKRNAPKAAEAGKAGASVYDAELAKENERLRADF